MKTLILITLLTCTLGGVLSLKAQEKRFDITGGGQLPVDLKLYVGTWVATDGDTQLKMKIEAKPVHINDAPINFHTHTFILTFEKLMEGNKNIAAKYPKLETTPIHKQANWQVVDVMDPRASIRIRLDFEPLPDGNLLFIPRYMENSFDKPAGKYIFPLGKPITLKRVK